jgi:hypothetical protein
MRPYVGEIRSKYDRAESETPRKILPLISVANPGSIPGRPFFLLSNLLRTLCSLMVVQSIFFFQFDEIQLMGCGSLGFLSRRVFQSCKFQVQS